MRVKGGKSTVFNIWSMDIADRNIRSRYVMCAFTCIWSRTCTGTWTTADSVSTCKVAPNEWPALYLKVASRRYAII